MIAGECVCGKPIKLLDDTTDVFEALQVWRKKHQCPALVVETPSIVERMADGDDPVDGM